MSTPKKKMPDPSGDIRKRGGEDRVVRTEIDSGEPGSGERDDARLDERLPGNAREVPGGRDPRAERAGYKNTDEI